MSEWAGIHDLSIEYKIELSALAELIEEKKIRTRGRSYDEINQKDQSDSKPRYIPEEIWRDGLIQEASFIFLYIYRGYGFKEQDRGIQVGYVDIQIDMEDFRKKVLVKTINPSKRSHKNIETFRTIYNDYANGKDWVSPTDLLEHIIDEHDHRTGETDKVETLALIDLQENYEKRTKSTFTYSINGGVIRDITYGRFYNIICDFNKDNGK
jgi:hypothetical protein